MIEEYILAEMAASHEGDPKIADFIIDSAAKARADGILFQLIDLESYIAPQDEDYEDIKSFAMSQGDWDLLFKKANFLGLDVWANVYDLKSFDFCQDKKIKGYKLHSSNLENRELVKKIAESSKEILLSIGGMSKEEIKEIISFIRLISKEAKLYLMYGLQNFPTKPEDINLNFIKSLSEELEIPWGYQDHSEPNSPASTYLSILAQGLGASIIEKHITHNRGLKGQDYEAALNPDEFIDFVKNIKSAENILAKKSEEVSAGEMKYKEYKTLMKVAAKKDIEKGEKFSKENLAVIRAKKEGIAGRYLEQLIGKESQFSYKKYDPLMMGELLKVGIFITARLKSTRLPLKAIKPILGKPMIGWMIERVKKANIEPIILMTSTNPQDDPLIEVAKNNNIGYFRGSEEDVLLRIRDCARQFGVDLVISVTADDPLKEPIFIKKLIEKYLEDKFDFCEIKGLPDGCEMYALLASAVEKVCEIKKDSDTEIWGPYFREAGIFKCDVLEVLDPAIYRPNYRVTVDTPEDFELVSKIFEALLKEKEYFNVYDICKLLDENPDLVKINSQIIPKIPPEPNFKSQ